MSALERKRLEGTLADTGTRLNEMREAVSQENLPQLRIMPPPEENPREKGIDKDRERTLYDYFLQDGITYTQAAALAGVNIKTAQRKFKEWASQIVEEEEYEDWSARQNRVRARALEGITRQILEVTAHQDVVQQIYNGIIYADSTGRLKPVEEIEHPLQRAYAAQLREIQDMLSTLRAESLVIQSAPPPDVILDREVEQAIAGKIERGSTDIRKSE